ncbi:hypothetical protein SO802_005843 [Lithocarpus litseifolius]|uniref:Uncharacterized protein n=1 Tax=Lithocarpus litseifolius TaxID=425828 RepID=A0AAW2DNG6_9ROSI
MALEIDAHLSKVWNTVAGNKLYTFEGHKAPAYSMCPHNKEILHAAPCIQFYKEGILLAVSRSENGIKILANAEGIWLLHSIENQAVDTSSRYKVGPKCHFFTWIDNPTCVRGNEAAHFVQQKMDLLRSELQLAHERERAATQVAAEATQMVEIAQDRAAKATERERKLRASSVQAKEIAVRALEQERKCRIALMLSCFFFILVMLFSYFSSSENVGMMKLSLPGGL